MKKTLLSCLLLAVTSLPVAVQAAESYGSREAQTNTLLACRDALGISADLAIYTLDFDDGRVLLSAVNRDGITLRQARSINRCKRESLAANPTGWESTVAASPAPAAHQGQASVQGVHIAQPTSWTAPGCPPKFNGMFRGNLYCVNGKPFE